MYAPSPCSCIFHRPPAQGSGERSGASVSDEACAAASWVDKQADAVLAWSVPNYVCTQDAPTYVQHTHKYVLPSKHMYTHDRPDLGEGKGGGEGGMVDLQWPRPCGRFIMAEATRLFSSRPRPRELLSLCIYSLWRQRTYACLHTWLRRNLLLPFLPSFLPSFLPVAS